ncbi:MAG: apolipoprotein N-acyltransferase [Chitinivibrionales bacterium]|nr:apolipoprotein N-acyltransferase [Chitinivibrionales bacterium]
MLQITKPNILEWFTAQNRWWLALAAGLLYPLCLPPFSGQTHRAFAFFPLLSLVAFVPLFIFALAPSLKRAFFYCYLFGAACCIGQYYWIIFDTAEGLWYLIIIGLVLISLFIALFYVGAALCFRIFYRRSPWLAIAATPAAWVAIEYARGMGEFSFPWTLSGYSLGQILPLAQLSSLTGVYGLSFLTILANVLIVNIILDWGKGRALKKNILPLLVLLCGFIAVYFWGAQRCRRPLTGESASIALIQNNIDQNHWGNNSLDTALAITEAMVYSAAIKKPDLIVLPESGIFCYLARTAGVKRQVVNWFDSTHIPLVLGTLHWNVAPKSSSYPYLVYNSAFLLDSGSLRAVARDGPTYPFDHYFKIKLVPFSEAIPFQGIFPILSRVNLGQADFKSGKDTTIFAIGAKIRAVPLICYEIIYPDFVRNCVNRRPDINLLVNITNDGWFGRSSGPYQHAIMSRLRCIENGIALARCANSGVSMLTDAYGRTTLRSGLYIRDVVAGQVRLARVKTFYSAHGDWPALWSWILALGAFVMVFGRSRKRLK